MTKASKVYFGFRVSRPGLAPGSGGAGVEAEVLLQGSRRTRLSDRAARGTRSAPGRRRRVGLAGGLVVQGLDLRARRRRPRRRQGGLQHRRGSAPRSAPWSTVGHGQDERAARAVAGEHLGEGRSPHRIGHLRPQQLCRRDHTPTESPTRATALRVLPNPQPRPHAVENLRVRPAALPAARSAEPDRPIAVDPPSSGVHRAPGSGAADRSSALPCDFKCCFPGCRRRSA